jgi:GNAT superfamily N-acetyltransferase
LEITTFKKDYLPDLAALFVQNFRKLRAAVPALPDLMEDTDRIVGMLGRLSDICPGVVAVKNGKLLGYMGWFVADHFRDTERRAAYCPEWGHAAVEEAKSEVYGAMYHEAARHWADCGCHVHALTLLAHDREAEKIWFWYGFGLTVVDAIRATLPLDGVSPRDVCVRKAGLDDVEALAMMEVEHRQHYSQPPVLMAAHPPADADALAGFICEPNNSIWLAVDGDDYIGYLRFDASDADSVAVVAAPDRIANTAAYVRSQYRGRGAATAVLNAALRDYAGRGFRRCSVDFESFNPEAVSFWLRFFEPVCFSVLRVPERQPHHGL